MKVAVLSDIHGNLEAFEAVSTDLVRRGADRVVCLGDNIGYGPDPEEVVQRIRTLGYLSILGNHEMALGDWRARRWLNFQAEENNVMTADLLSGESHDYCRRLPAFLALDEAYFVHGFPPASVFRYLDRQSDDTLHELLTGSTFSLLFLGHTHKLELVRHERGSIVRQVPGQGRIDLQPGVKYVFNAGSVGQPRDGDRRAKYLLWDRASACVEVLFVDYDFSRTVEKIRERGFPAIYARRLAIL